jgi:hypothetical protein
VGNVEIIGRKVPSAGLTVLGYRPQGVLPESKDYYWSMSISAGEGQLLTGSTAREVVNAINDVFRQVACPNV